MRSFDLDDRHLILQTIDMAITLPIKRMSREDKLRAMEALWADLSRDEAKVESPGWHGAALRNAQQLLRNGKAEFSDWQAARRRLRRKAKNCLETVSKRQLPVRSVKLLTGVIPFVEVTRLQYFFIPS
jgi:hypothetical protein